MNMEPTPDTWFYDADHDRAYMRLVGGAIPPNQEGPGHFVIAAMERPMQGRPPNIWVLAEESFVRTEDLLEAMSRAHVHYKALVHYVRFKKSREGFRVFDAMSKHIQQFNLEAATRRRYPIIAMNAPWVGDRGSLAFQLEKMHTELMVGNRTIFWNDPVPACVSALNGVEEWEGVTDVKNTMIGALCYAVCGLLADRPTFDMTGRLTSGTSVSKTKRGKVPFDKWVGRRKP
jgi:hypothetical protein